MNLRQEFIVGGSKEAGSDAVIADPEVSRLQFTIRQQQDKMYISDNQSANGTYVNDIRLQPYEEIEIEEGDRIRISDSIILRLSQSGASPTQIEQIEPDTPTQEEQRLPRRIDRKNPFFPDEDSKTYTDWGDEL
jgi:pSer/pThr/pTyr-binding forkhead associated (FHA) protein